MKKIISFLTAFTLFFLSFAQAQDENKKVYTFEKKDGQYSLYTDGTTVQAYVDAGNEPSTLVSATIEGTRYIMYKSSYDKYQQVYGVASSQTNSPASAGAEKLGKQKDKKIAVEKIASIGVSQIPTHNGYMTIPDVSLGIATTKVDADGVVKKNTIMVSDVVSTGFAIKNVFSRNPVYTNPMPYYGFLPTIY